MKLFEKINKELLKEIGMCKSFQGKGILLTLAIRPKEEIFKVKEIIRQYQASIPMKRDKVQAKLIKEIVKYTLNQLSEINDLPEYGCVLFAGQIRTSEGRKKDYLKIVEPLVEGYDEYFKGKIETRFYTDPYKDYLNTQEINRQKENRELLAKKLADIEKELGEDDSNVIYGTSHVKQIISEGKAEQVIFSTKLKNIILCPNCQVSNLIKNMKCKNCNMEIGPNKINLYDEIIDMCKITNTTCIEFDIEISSVLDEKYYSIVCFTRY